MDQLVKSYTSLDRKATNAESRADEYRQRFELCRWEQCRIAHEATEQGFTQTAFAAGVGKSATTIKRQVAAWRTYGSHATLPPYGEAMAGAVGTTASAENGRKRLSTARAVLTDPEAMATLLADPRVRMAAGRALRDAPIFRAQPPEDRDGHRAPGDELVVTVGRLVKRLNAERREGRVSPRDVRTVARRMRIFADVLERVATAKGLDDDELETLVSLEVFGRSGRNGHRVAA